LILFLLPETDPRDEGCMRTSPESVVEAAAGAIF
jgi:hypothetical protein